MRYWIVAFLAIVGMMLVFVAVDRITTDLQLEMQTNATLRRQVVALEEENKVFHEVFECFVLKSELGLIEEEANE